MRIGGRGRGPSSGFKVQSSKFRNGAEVQCPTAAEAERSFDTKPRRRVGRRWAPIHTEAGRGFFLRRGRGGQRFCRRSAPMNTDGGGLERVVLIENELRKRLLTPLSGGRLFLGGV